MVEEKPDDELEQMLISVPSQLRRRHREAMKGVYATESEAIRDYMRKFAEARGC